MRRQFLLLWLVFSSCLGGNESEGFPLYSTLRDTLKVCGHEYPIEYSTQFVTDQDLDVQFASIRNRKTGEIMLGYAVEGRRHDSIFIKSKIRQEGNFVIRTEFRFFESAQESDSTVGIFECVGDSIKLRHSKRYKGGVVTYSQTSY
jgi:hypothetical protein